MAFPTTTVNTTNLDSSTDDPSQARVDLLDAVNKLNTIIDEADTAFGVPTLSSTGTIQSNQIPATISAAGTQTLSPSTGIVNIQNVLRVAPQGESTILALTDLQEGDFVICANLISSGANVGGIAFYTGTDWVGLPWTSNVFVSMS